MVLPVARFPCCLVFFLLYSMPLYACIVISLSILLLADIWKVPRFSLWYTTLLYIF